MSTSLKKEIPILIVVLIPFIYLAFIWSSLPDIVPIHWNINGEIDGYGSKKMLLIIPFILPLLTYLIMALVPKIDPRINIEEMGNKYSTIKIILVTIMSVLAVIILYSSHKQAITSPTLVVLLVGVLMTTLGNYLKTVKPNYFIGIRTPWTLENKEVWKATHELGGKIWFAAGLVIIVSYFIIPTSLIMYVFILIAVLAAVIPIVYSYYKYKIQVD